MKNEFKKGDRVRVTNAISAWISDGRQLEGVVMQVKENLDSPFLVKFEGWTGGHNNEHMQDGFISDKKDCWWLKFSDLELVEAAPAVQFKVGDKGKTRGGHEYEILATDGDAVHLNRPQPIKAKIIKASGRTDEGYFYTSGKYRQGDDGLDLLPPETSKLRIEPIPLKVGDRVEYTDRFSGMYEKMIGFRGTVADEGGCFLPEVCRVDWDNGHTLTGVFKGNLRKLEAWEVAMESGEFYFIAPGTRPIVYKASRDGDGWTVLWRNPDNGEPVSLYYRDKTVRDALESGQWEISNGVPAAPKPDPVAEAAAAYKAAVAARLEAEKVHQAASEALHQADARYSEAFHAQRKAEAKLLEVSAGLT